MAQMQRWSYRPPEERCNQWVGDGSPLPNIHDRQLETCLMKGMDITTRCLTITRGFGNISVKNVALNA